MVRKSTLNLKKESEVLKGLNSEQQRAVLHGQGPLLIVAGAGTGKTTVITRRIAHLIEQGVKPEEILALTFAEKAAEEMEERVDQLLPFGYYNLQISTFHSFGERILKQWGLEIGLPDFKVLDETGQWLLVKNNLESFKLDYYKPLGNPTRFIKALIRHFSRAKDELVLPDEYSRYAEKLRLNLDIEPKGAKLSKQDAKKAESDFEYSQVLDDIKKIEEVANAYHVYQRLLLERGYVDFGDLINYCHTLFIKRPQVLQKFQKQYRYILIDEFQDTNFAQYELIKLLSRPANNITVVGDDDQSIFKFRGASISNIMHFKNDYPNAKFITLTQNYRNAQLILDSAYEFIKQNDPDRLELKLGISKKLISNLNPAGNIEHHVVPDYVQEARLAADKIIELVSKGAQLNDFAILVRSHDLLIPFIEEFETRGISYMYFANKGLYRKSIVLDILNYFKLLDNYHESEALYRVLRFPEFGVSTGGIIEAGHFAKKKSFSLFEALKRAATIKNIVPKDLEAINKLLAMIERHSQLAARKNVTEVFQSVLEDLKFSKRFEAAQQESDLQNYKYIEALFKKLQNFQDGAPNKTTRAFLEQVNFELEAGEHGKLEFDPEAGPQAVKLMTVHAAKGLEFSCVLIPGLVDKRFPSIDRKEAIELPDELVKDIIPEGDAHIQEERRLFYVGMTRAKNTLILSRALDYGGKLTKKPSRFLIEMGLAESEVSRPSGKVNFIKQKDRAALPIPKQFSFSQISTFIKCPLQYKYQYVFGLPGKGSAQQSFGITIHKTFERYMRLLMQTGQGQDLFGINRQKHLIDFPRLDLLRKFYEEEWIPDWYESKFQMEEYREKGYEMLERFFLEIQQNSPKPIFIEEWFRMRLGDSYFVGKIDRADESPQGAVVIDYKTGSARGINNIEREQLLVYQWAMEEYFKKSVSDLQYWFLKDKLKKASFIGNAGDIEKLKSKLINVTREIIAACEGNSFEELDGRISHDCRYQTFE